MITYKQEFYKDLRHDLPGLIQMHYNEIALNKDIIKLNPDWDAYQKMEAQGFTRAFTARDGDKLVGYAVFVVTTALHYKDHLFACNDIFYLHPEYRKGFVGYKLLKNAMGWLKDDGVTKVHFNTKVHKPLDALFERLGCTLIENIYAKVL